MKTKKGGGGGIKHRGPKEDGEQKRRILIYLKIPFLFFFFPLAAAAAPNTFPKRLFVSSLSAFVPRTVIVSFCNQISSTAAAGGKHSEHSPTGTEQNGPASTGLLSFPSTILGKWGVANQPLLTCLSLSFGPSRESDLLIRQSIYSARALDHRSHESAVRPSVVIFFRSKGRK